MCVADPLMDPLMLDNFMFLWKQYMYCRSKWWLSCLLSSTCINGYNDSVNNNKVIWEWNRKQVIYCKHSPIYKTKLLKSSTKHKTYNGNAFTATNNHPNYYLNSYQIFLLNQCHLHSERSHPMNQFNSYSHIMSHPLGLQPHWTLAAQNLIH